MKALFADAYYYLALLSREDAAHDRAVRASKTLATHSLTTAWVLTEVADGLAAPGQREAFVRLMTTLRANPHVTVVPPTQDLFEQGVNLFAERHDKGRSLTDCISFIVMHEHGLIEALTADHHFEQAGFTALLK